MRANTLCILFGAACASAWWAFATIVPPSGDKGFVIVPILLSMGVLAVIINESVKD